MLRDYRQQDFDSCVAIVGKVWDFAGNLHPPAFATFVNRLYTGSSLAESRYAKVIAGDDGATGLLFGRCGPGPVVPTVYSGVGGRLRTVAKLMAIRDMRARDKWSWLNLIAAHEAARRKVAPRTEGEVNLFAVDPVAQGFGYGRALMDDYVAHCRRAGLDKLTVETDVESNYGFYEHYGFTLVGEFHSAMNQRFSGGSGTSFVYELTI